MEPLPEYEYKFINADTLLTVIQEAHARNCRDEQDVALLTIIDFRTENFLELDRRLPSIKTNCQTMRLLLDDLKHPEVRSQIPNQGLVVLVCETGNRDWAALRYLYKWGYTNLVGLRFGMRGWIKQDFPTTYVK